MTYAVEEEVFPTLNVDDALKKEEDGGSVAAVEEEGSKLSGKRKEPENNTEKKVSGPGFCYELLHFCCTLVLTITSFGIMSGSYMCIGERVCVLPCDSGE